MKPSSSPTPRTPGENRTSMDRLATKDARYLLNAYMANVTQHPVLSHQEEIDLGRAIKEGVEAQSPLKTDSESSHSHTQNALKNKINTMESAKRTLTLCNLRLVVFIAKRYQHRGLDLMDLIQEGNVGLMTAVDKYDFVKGVKFSSYASYWIHQAIQTALTQKGRTIRYSSYVNRKLVAINNWRHSLRDTLHREPELEELSKKSSIDLKKLEELRLLAIPTVSLQAPLSGGSEGESFDETLQDLTPNEQAPTEDELIDAISTAPRIRKLIESLPHRERMVIEAHFGFNDQEEMTLEEIRDKAYPLLNPHSPTISREGIRLIILNALEKLSKELKHDEQDRRTRSIHKSAKEIRRDKQARRRTQSINNSAYNLSKDI